ncbi:MAG: hypothetical protein QM761_06660 [Pseudoxanthomonas sp.]
MKQQLRAAARKGDQAVVGYLTKSRAERSPAEFRSCVSALKIYAPKQAQHLFFGGAYSFKDLVWSRQSFEPMALDRELEWAIHWLAGQSRKINVFRDFAMRVQDLVLRGKTIDALAAIDRHMETSGWSLWGLELRCGLGPIAAGADAQRKWAAALQATAPNSIPALLVHIFSERNDETFSYDSFFSKCMDSFHRYKSVVDWLPRYLLYRSLGFYSDPKATLSSALARDATSCLFDYYETLLDAIKTICSDKSIRALRPAALLVVQALRKDGFTDHRLAKLEVALSGKFEGVDVRNENEMVGDMSAFLCGRTSAPSLDYGEPIRPLIELVKESRSQGVSAGNAIAVLLKFGINFRGLDVGLAFGMSAQDATSDLISTRLVSLDCVLVSPDLFPEDVAGFPDDVGREIIRRFSNVDEPADSERCTYVTRVLDGEPVTEMYIGPSVLDLWLGRQLIVTGRHSEASLLGEKLEELGFEWGRQGAKLRFWALIREHKLPEALEFAAKWIVASPEYVVELPFKDLFEGREWGRFRELNPVLVALAAHHVSVATGSSHTGYICKMACRKFAIDGRNAVGATYEAATPDDRAQLTLFLREVWIEENLSMNHFLESTDDVRAERMKVLQMLLGWDEENQQAYIDQIKDLTFDDTLRQGLRHINQTRVFVNETGITRWAEKELHQDLERWVSLAGSPGNTEVASGLVRQYVVDPQSEAFLEALGRGKPTEADALLTSLIDRLFKRFLTDPADGLDCYLSLRIRHGSLRGTLFGPLEEQGLLYSGSGFSRAAFESQWMSQMDLSQEQAADVVALMERFTSNLRAVADELINERVQIRSEEKPRGAIVQFVLPAAALIFTSVLVAQQVSITSFAYSSYFIFWKLIEQGLEELAAHVRDEVKSSIQSEFDELVSGLRKVSNKTLPLITALTTVSTTTQAQCDSIADWFKLPGKSDDEKYKLSVAIEIAREATKNVHRTFPAEVRVGQMPYEDLPLTTLALAALSDCLFVIFDNAWKHSGLAANTGEMDLDASFDATNKLLSLTVRSSLSEDVRTRLETGLMQELCDRYLTKAPIELASREGGSGFAKLARLSRYVDRERCSEPLSFGIVDGRWFTSVTISLFERDGAYEALQ